MGVWSLFRRSLRRANFRGMDGVPAGLLLCCVEKAAKALRVDWNEVTLNKLEILENAWLGEVDRIVEEKRETAERELRPKRKGRKGRRG